VLKIETDGSGAIRLLGDFSYTARFDGKQYDLKSSRNDTVVLELVDPLTVESVYGARRSSRKKTDGCFPLTGSC
jgi:hypothetical protein